MNGVCGIRLLKPKSIWSEQIVLSPGRSWKRRCNAKPLQSALEGFRSDSISDYPQGDSNPCLSRERAMS